MSSSTPFSNGYLLTRERAVKWTRSRPYKKNDQAHVEQKNFTHVRQLLGYGRYGEIELKALVDDLYENAWLPLRNHFTPVMKLVEKTRVGSKVKKKYDKPRTPYQRLLECPEVSRKIKGELRREHRELDAIGLARAVEQKLVVIYGIVERIEEEREKLREWAGGALPLLRSSPGPSNRGKSLPEQSKRRKNRPSLGCHESWCNDPPPSVSSFIGSTREDNCNYEKPEHGLSWREFRILTAILSWPTTREGFTSIG